MTQTNENPGARASATGAISEQTFKTAHYRKRADAATDLCHAIAACAPQDAVIIMRAAILDLAGRVAT